jgi:hypothetical protein
MRFYLICFTDGYLNDSTLLVRKDVDLEKITK